MAQAMIDIKNKMRNNSTQTGDSFDFTFFLSNTKSIRLYKSKSYKDFVLCLNLGKSKKFIITKEMWKIFKIYIPLINNTLSNKDFI